jgi:Ni/Fe-hydrogenase subunit HybB-like protein
MSLNFTTLEAKSREYKTLVGALIVLSAAGFLCFLLSYIKGHQLLGGGNLIPWGMPIVVAIYLIGLSAGSLILSSLTYVFGKEEYKPISRLAIFLAIVLIFGALVGIGLDLGRPEKSWRLFMFFVLNNMRSMFAINGILYGGYFLIGLIYLWSVFAGRSKMPRVMAIIAVCWAALVHMGTGAIFGFVAARPLYYSPLKPFEFLSAAMVSGLALLILVIVVVFKYAKRVYDPKIIFSLSRLLLALIVGLVVIVLIDKLTHLYPPERESVLWLFTGPYAWAFWGLQVGCGYVFPLILLIHPRTSKSLRGVVVAAISVVIGIFGERFALVIPGTAEPMPFFPGTIEGVWGSAGIFRFTPVETLMSLGVFTLMGLFFVLGLNYLELLPATESKEEKPAPA